MNPPIERIQTAIDRLKMFEPPEGYYLAFSGGKDSIVLHDLAVKSGVRFDAHFNLTTVDPPELVSFIRRNYSDVSIDPPKLSMLQLIIRKGCLPTRKIRFCCEHLKERGGVGRYVLTGTRWEESSARAKRPVTNYCGKLGKRFLHPIIDWSHEQIWRYIHSERLIYPELYNRGYKRIGCVLCPMANRHRLIEYEDFPQIAGIYKLAITKLREMGKYSQFNSTEAVFNWWIRGEEGLLPQDQEMFNFE